jgi:hypothetical protein
MANTFLSFPIKDVGTAVATVYTVPASTTTTCIGMSVSNTLPATAIKVDVYFTRGGVDYYLVKGADVAVGGALVVVGGEQKLVLQTGDVLKVKSSVAASVDAILSVLNIT